MHTRLTLIPLVTLALVGCGGGGGGGGGGDVNTGNAKLAAKESYSAAKGLLAFGNQSSAGTKLAGRPTTPAASLEGSEGPHFDVRSFLRDQLKTARDRVRGQQLAQVRYEDTFMFEGGGSFSLIYDDKDNTNTFSTGDTFEFVFTNLQSQEETGEVCTTNGSLLIDQVVIDNPSNYDNGVAPYSASLRLVINLSETCVLNNVATTENFNGAFRTTEVLTSTQLSETFETVGTVGEVTDLIITQTQTLGSSPTWTQAISGSVFIPTVGTISFSTPTPLSGAGDPETSDPTAGVLEVTDGADIVRITINGTTVTIEFKSGAGSFQLVETVPISELE
ncbi:MAG TPA: hypothetical protein VFZ65_16780 [Planctomycetota bacterium]|nr:hypothetical protein [Planctomycetota bacterium]